VTDVTLVNPSRSGCCPEYAALSRRTVLGGAVAMAGATSVFGSAVLTAGPASAATAGSVLVVLSLRGAADGLSLVVPHGDPVYYQARPAIGVPKDQLLVPDGFFGLHPALKPLLPLWNSGAMATIHATGMATANRSHFAAMEVVEDAAPGSSARVGWLNRLIGTQAGTSALQGFSVSSGVLPTSLVGPEAAMSAGSVDSVKFAGDDQWDKIGGRMRSLHSLWDAESSTLGTGMRSAFTAVDAFEPVAATLDHRSSYPSGDLGDALSTAARLVRGDVGIEVITVDHGDWDMHADLGTLQWGRMVTNAAELARSIAAFFADLGPMASKVTLVTISEFGRRVVENASYGLDHGYGNVMMAFGAGVKGGYYGRWPGLSNSLDSDLTVTTDYRNVLADVVGSRFGASIPTVFPGLTRESVGFMQA
jgi:uncharacterized protein (DUF1501 family)